MKDDEMAAWIAGRLRALRKEKSLSVRGLARAAGITTEMASRAERNVKTPSVQTLAKLAEAMGVSLGEFFGGAAGGPKPPTRSSDAVAFLLQGVEGPARQHLVDGFRSIAKGVRVLTAAQRGPTLRATSARRRH